MPASGESPRRVRVLLVEDYLVMGEGLRALLDTQHDLEVVGLATTVRDAIGLAARTAPDVVLADYRLPDGTGADLAVALRDRRPRAAVVFLSAVDTAATLIAAVEAGARGYLLKSRAGDEVVDAVRRAAAGEMLIPATVIAELLSPSTSPTARSAARSPSTR